MSLASGTIKRKSWGTGTIFESTPSWRCVDHQSVWGPAVEHGQRRRPGSAGTRPGGSD